MKNKLKIFLSVGVALATALLSGCATTHSPVLYTPPLRMATNPTTPQRTTPQVIAVWIAPYVDSADNFHGSNTIYTVVMPSRWVSLQNVTTQKGTAHG